jgi:hypothetical protein
MKADEGNKTASALLAIFPFVSMVLFPYVLNPSVHASCSQQIIRLY